MLFAWRNLAPLKVLYVSENHEGISALPGYELSMCSTD